MPVAPFGWMGAAGEAAAGVSGDQGHGLAVGGEALGSAEGEWHAVGVDDGGPNLGLIRNPEQLIGGELAAVGVSASPAFASRSSTPMVTITDAGVPPTEG